MLKTIRELLKENLTRIRKSKGLSQEELASLIEVETETVNRYSNFKRFPSPEKLDKIAEKLGVNQYELIKDVTDEKTKNDLIVSIISQLPLLETNDLAMFEASITKVASKRSRVGATNIIKKPVNI